MLVVVQARFRVGVVTREPERGTRRPPPGRVAPQRVLLVAGQGSVGISQLGRGPDEVGDDGVETAVYLFLGGLGQVGGRDVLRLGERGEAAGPVVPRDD